MNPSKCKTIDCVIGAASFATNQDWETTYYYIHMKGNADGYICKLLSFQSISTCQKITGAIVTITSLKDTF